MGEERTGNRLRVFVLIEDLSSFPEITSCGSHLPIILDPRGLTPSPGLHEHLHTYLCIHIHISETKIFLRREGERKKNGKEREKG